VRRAVRNLMVAAAVCLPAAAADAVDAAPVRQAVELLGRFPGEVESIAATLTRISLSSGKVSYVCSYTPLGKAAMYGDRKARYDGQISFSDLDAGLQPKVRAAQNSAREFASGFAPLLRQWAQTTLPDTSNAFIGASGELLGIQDEVRRGVGPNESQRTRAIAALDRILAPLGSGKGQLAGMAGILSRYLQQQRAARGSLSDWSAAAAGEIQRRAQRIREEMNRQRCLGDGPAQPDGIVRRANASIGAIAAGVGELEKRETEADRALALVLGTFVGYVSRYEAVAERLKVVREAPLGSTIQSLQLSIASRTWQDLVAAAKAAGI